MTRARTRPGPLLASLLGLLPALLLAAAPKEPADDGPGFSLLPRSLQKNPLVGQTVITEMTAEGRKLPPPSPDHPAYYVAEIAGNHREGAGAAENHPPAVGDLTTCLQHALAVNGFLPTSREHPPTLLIVYFWGSHSNRDAGSTENEDSAVVDIDHKHLLSRAALVGGTKFAEDLRVALQKQDVETIAQQGLMRAEAQLGVQTELGSMLLDYGPLRLFADRDEKTRRLWQALGERYYVVASAYDYAEAAHGRRRLLWRTKMTVESEGLAMNDALPGLVMNAGEFLGVDMPEAATMTKRVHREGSVQLGPLEVKGYSSPTPAAPAGATERPR